MQNITASGQATLFNLDEILNNENTKDSVVTPVVIPPSKVPEHRFLCLYQQNLPTENVSVYSDKFWQVLNGRGINNKTQLDLFINPEKVQVDSPEQHFKDLVLAKDLITSAINNQEKIAVVGDYDADGMTSTALLIRAFRGLGAYINYEIPDRIAEGYAINPAIVEKLALEGVKLIITVDNGITSVSSADKCKELGVKLIITDHHEIPAILPDADAILNPRLLPEDSIYENLAGVGVAYILAAAVALGMGRKDFMVQALTLAAVGTIADMATLTGINRRWVTRGMAFIGSCGIPGVAALIDQAQMRGGSKSVSTSDIGFKIAPMINAIGRIGDPKIIVELLTTDDPDIAKSLAIKCAACNYERQVLSKSITEQAIAQVEKNYLSTLQQDKVLFVVAENWHPGVVGLVASKLVENYGVPAFVGVIVEKDREKQIKFSARGIPEFSVGDAMRANSELFIKFGGHPLAGGGSLKFDNYDVLRQGLINFANSCIKDEDVKPLFKIDAEINFDEILQIFFESKLLSPVGIGNPEPVFSAKNVKVVKQELMGKDKTHVSVTLSQVVDGEVHEIRCVAWSYARYFPLPENLDMVFKLGENSYMNKTTIQPQIISHSLSGK
jgi:single-stranded-DNA-specific exonuclease